MLLVQFFLSVSCDIPVISTSPCSSIAFSNALLLALFCALSNFLAFFPETGANGPLVGASTLLLKVPRAFLVTLLWEFRFCTFDRLAILRCLFGTFGLPREGIMTADEGCWCFDGG